ncbi:MAG: hypothetical protein QOF01_218 [Thermomicrobiales bacterium]|nr:hypothetical protein [Thermomicrobiales bacterium]
MAEERHTTAFVVGFVLGGLAGAAVTLWKTPRSGAQTRALLAERAEEFLFRLTGMDKPQPEGAASGSSARPFDTASTRGDATTSVATKTLSDPLAATPVQGMDEDDGATLPPTFRGQILTEQPTDIVLDGPRPAPPDH